MNIFEQLEFVVNNITSNSNSNNEFYPFFIENDIQNGIGLNASKNYVPWDQRFPSSNHSDFDSDGIPDSLDNFFGPGALPYE